MLNQIRIWKMCQLRKTKEFETPWINTKNSGTYYKSGCFEKNMSWVKTFNFNFPAQNWWYWQFKSNQGFLYHAFTWYKDLILILNQIWIWKNRFKIGHIINPDWKWKMGSVWYPCSTYFIHTVINYYDRYSKLAKFSIRTGISIHLIEVVLLLPMVDLGEKAKIVFLISLWQVHNSNLFDAAENLQPPSTFSVNTGQLIWMVNSTWF